MKNSSYTHNGSFRRSFFGLLKAVFMCAAYGALWIGIIFRTCSWGVPLIVCGGAAVLLSLFLFAVIPLSRIK